jgi:cytochrome c-type biogenesis protein CcmH
VIARLRLVALAALVVLALVVAGRGGSGPTTDAARAAHLGEQLRCPVCEGLSVADSPSSTARAMAADIRRRVEAGESDDAIRRAYIAQYGSWILLEPPGAGFGLVAWALPIGCAVAALGGVALVLRRRALLVRAMDVP